MLGPTHNIHSLFRFSYCHSGTEERTTLASTFPVTGPSVHDYGYAIKVDAVAESYLNVGGICCLVL